MTNYEIPSNLSDNEIKLIENILNLLGAFDTPIAKRKFSSEFTKQAILEAKQQLVSMGVKARSLA